MQKQRLLNRLNFAEKQIEQARADAKQAAMILELWQGEAKAVRKDLEDGQE